jgi:preprotein translocase subunit Sec63
MLIQYSPFFFIVVLLLIIAPLSVTRKKRSLQTCNCRPCLRKVRRLRKHSPRYLLVFGWLVIFHLARSIYLSPSVQVWDPYQILDVTPLSSYKVIKRQYKRKSLKYHPDKQRGISKEEAEDKFRDLTRAYKVYIVSIY